MKFGVREICNVVFKAKTAHKIGSMKVAPGQPVLYIDTAKTSTLEGAATTVYATGGRGNTRLIAWEGEKTLTFTVEDALLSPVGYAILSGAGLIHGNEEQQVHVHTSSRVMVDNGGKIDLTDALATDEKICPTAPIFVLETSDDGSITGAVEGEAAVDETGKIITIEAAETGTVVLVDYYILKTEAQVHELVIDAKNFAGYYYVEADTLFRDQATGKDMPAIITLPNVKIQSNFTFTMASTGDPSTFTFTMDAFPGYTYFDKTRQVMCVIQIVEDVISTESEFTTVMGCYDKAEEDDLRADG